MSKIYLKEEHLLLQKMVRDFSNQVFFVFQNKPRGTGHAVQQAVELFDKYNYIYVL